MNLDTMLNLAERRAAAKLTQSEMAERMGVTQSQISRYEQDPGSAPALQVVNFLRICGEVSASTGVKMTDPRVELVERMALLRAYCGVEPTAPAGIVTPANLAADNFLSSVRALARKPVIGCVGNFDAGKSTAINQLLGRQVLPTGYQPKTRIQVLLRHKGDRPSFQREDVWLFGKGFKLHMASDESHCIEHKLFAGGYESLRQFGVHGESGAEENVVASVAYVDAPILLGADLLDSPGYQNNETDQEHAELAHRIVDGMLFLSPIDSFLDSSEIFLLSQLIRTLPVTESSDSPDQVLRNLFIVATRAHHVDEQEAGNILLLAAKRLHSELENVLRERLAMTGVTVSVDDIRKRMSTFSVEHAELRGDLERDLISLVRDVDPPSKIKALGDFLLKTKITAKTDCEARIEQLLLVLNERETAQRELAGILSKEPERIQRQLDQVGEIDILIDSLSNECAEFVRTTVANKTTVEAIEATIKRKYSSKKEAQNRAPTFIVDSIQSDINQKIQDQATSLSRRIDRFLQEFAPSINDDHLRSVDGGFDAQIAFLSALSGIGTVGALAVWASIAAAGSNLGGYILVGQIVGWLSSIGIGFGSAGSVMAWVAGVGGPITLAIAAGVLAAVLTFSLFGDSWETKLAKKISSMFEQKGVSKTMADGVLRYWRETKTAFHEGVKRTEMAYQDKLGSLRTMASSTDREKLEAELIHVKTIKDFFAGMPWRVAT